MENPWQVSTDPEAQQKASALQGELIHIFWGYHSHRLAHGFPFALGNPLIDTISTKNNAQNDVSNTPSPAALIRSLREGGYRDFNLLDAVKSDADQSAISIISQGITASMWDSLNHVVGFYRDNVPPNYQEFIADDDVRTLRQDADALGKNQSSFQGSGTLHAGARVGVETMTFFSALEYGLPEGHPLNAKDIAYALSKTDSFRLSLRSMDRAILSLSPTLQTLSNFHDAKSPMGFPAQKMKEYCVPDALGCSARAKIGEAATALLQKHGLYSPTYDDTDKQSAIKLVAEKVRAFFFEQIDVLLTILTADEQAKHLCDTDRLLLQHIES